METSTAWLGDTRVQGVGAAIRAADEETLATQVELSEIAAPPFGEAARGTRLAGLMADAGLCDVHADPEGNVLGWASGPGGAAPSGPLVVSAHLDTVFPEGTDVSVVREGDLLRGPGISDDARGLATLVALARALGAARLATATPLLFVGTVGEEGPGDLRGVKHLFGPDGEAREASGFISLDGAGLDRIVARGLGSTRFRVTARGPGGHSWVDWGTANPIHHLAGIAASLTALPLPTTPLTTLTIARWGGGKSINAIPQEAWLEIDTRSGSAPHLHDLASEVRRVVADGAASTPPELTVEIETIGSRPGGSTPEDAPLVQAALEATRAVGGHPHLGESSTDANIPMALGIPAVTLGCGGEAGKAHTTGEWYRNTHGAEGIVRALYTVVLAAGLAD